MRRPVGVKWVLLFFRWTRFFSPAESPSLSPPFHPHSWMSDFFARCKLAFSFQPVLPPDCRPVFLLAEKLGQAINAVTGTRRFGLGLSFLRMFLLYAAAGMAMRPLLCNGSYPSPLTHK